MKKYLRIILIVVITVVFISYFAVEYAAKNILSYSAIKPSRVTKEMILTYYNDLANPSTVGLDYSDFNITVEDSIKLRGWFIYSEVKPAKGTIFILHGIGSCKNAMLPLAKTFCDEGFNCICYDSRASGESGGLYCTFGYFEKKDVSAYIDSAIVRYPDSSPYGIFGNSLGAAVSIQTMAIDKRLVCGIAQSPFADLQNIVRDYFARIALVRVNYIPDKALKYSEQIAHFKVDDVQPALSAKNITQPVMIIHGLEDKNINPSYGKKVFENLSSKEKFWYPIAHGDHNNLSIAGGSEYTERIVWFFQKYLVK